MIQTETVTAYSPTPSFSFWPEILTETPDFELVGIFCDWCATHGFDREEVALRWLATRERWPILALAANCRGLTWDWWTELAAWSDWGSEKCRASLPDIFMAKWQAESMCRYLESTSLEAALTWFIGRWHEIGGYPT